MRVCLISDTHAGARNDSLIFNDYFIRFYKEVFFPYLKKNNIKEIIHLGDLLDRRKYVNYATLSSWRKNVFEPINESYNMTIIHGNHDLYYRTNNDIDSLNELLRNYPNIKIVDKPTVVDYDGTDILLMPWVQESNIDSCKEMLTNPKAQILFGHFDIMGFEMYRGLTNDSTGFEPKDFDNFDVVCSGHYHHRSTKENINYLGSPYEIIWSDADDPRGFHIFDTDTRKLEFIHNPLKMHHKIVYDDTDKTLDDLIKETDISLYTNTYIKVIIKTKTNPYIFDQYLEALHKQNPADITVLDEIIEVNTTGELIEQAKDTLTLLVEYVNNMPIGNNKQPLIELMTKLYKEANELDV